MIRQFAALAALCCNGGCATPVVSMNADQQASLAGKSFAGVYQRPPGFFHMTAATGAMGGFGALMMQSQGDSFRDEHGIIDPAPTIEKRLTEKLAAAHGGNVAEARNTSITPIPAAPNGGKGLVYVDSVTTLWQYIYQPFDWGRYEVTYTGLTSIIDAESGARLGQYACSKKLPEKGQAPTEPELLLNHAELLNKMLMQMAETCASEFEAKVLGAPAN